MGIAIDTAVEWIGNIAERLLKPETAARVRAMLPDLPPEPALFNFGHDEEEGPGLFRELHFAEGVTRHVMPESLWREFEAFYRGRQPLSWWLVTAPAGSGKSRAALEFCRALETGRATLFRAGDFVTVEVEPVAGENYSEWKGGFLDLAETAHEDWEAWRPRRHTLLVLDKLAWSYDACVDDKGDGGEAAHSRYDVAEIIRLLAQKEARGDFGTFRVRLLFLEREYQETDGERRPLAWYQALPAYLSLRHKETPLPLPPLSPEGLFSIACDMQEYVRRNHPETLYVVPRDFLEKLGAIDDAQRPLFAMLLAAHTVRDNSEQVTRRQVLDYALWREYERVLRPVEIEKIPQAMKALLASTLTRGSVGTCKLDNMHPLWYSGLGAAAEGDASMFRFYPVEPDLLGEYLVLNGVNQDDILGSVSVGDDDLKSLILKAWETCPADVADFFECCGQDFSDDPGWIETRFLNDRMAEADPVVKTWYMRTATNIMTRFGKRRTGVARKVFEHMNRLGGEGAFRNERAGAALALVRAYCEAGLIDEASGIFTGMQSLGDSGEVRIRAVEASACLIEWLSKAGELERARVLYEGWLACENDAGLQLARAQALVGLISGYGKAGEFPEARQLLGSLAACGYSEPLLAQFAKAAINLVVLYARAGHLPEACEMFNSLGPLGDSPAVLDARIKAFKFLEFFTAGAAKSSGKQGQPPAAAA
ncbi:MAG: hypothetical protein LBP58_03630 [Azoarcus sp.]|jgi:pentatricopeptide repeat protein|nr:hypothetical protein [Azoarcus sp.]